MPAEQIYAWIATIFTTLIFMPQLYKAIKTRMTNDISMLMLFFSLFGNSAWFLHARLTGNLALLVCAVIIILVSVILIIFKYANERTAS